MIAFDADVLSLIFNGDSGCIQKAARIPVAEQCVPIVVIDQILRGRLHAIRQAEAGKAKADLDVAYFYLERTIADLKGAHVLSFMPSVEVMVQGWRNQKIKVGISDLRIAAICIVHSATLISRNRRDFDQVPGLLVEYW